MKSFKYMYLIVNIVLLGMVFNGCGGGSGNSENSDNIKYSRVCIAGSSITHGGGYQDEGTEGYLGEHSYVGYVEKYLREEVADTLNPKELMPASSTDKDLMSYMGQINIYFEGSTISGTLKASNEIAIVYAGSNESTTIEMEVDGKTYLYTIPAGRYSPVKKVFDDSRIDFYKAFRETNPQAVKVWKLPEIKEHQFKITVKKGRLHLNFITNHMFYIQNAGVSGFEAADFLSISREHSTVQDIIDFNPDLFIFESSTNDAKTWSAEISGDESTNEWLIEEPVRFIRDGNKIVLPFSINVTKGDVVIMGKYGGDITNMAVGIVSNSGNTDTLTFSKIISYDGKTIHEHKDIPSFIVNRCSVKRIKKWEERVEQIVRKVKDGTGKNNMLVGIGTSGVPNYYNPLDSGNPYVRAPYTPRRLLGYREKGQELARKNGWLFVDFFKNILAVESGVDVDRKWSMGDNTHPNPAGRKLFGDAVIDVLR